MFQWLFKYPWAEFLRGRLVLARDAPLWMLGLCFLVGALLWVWLGWRRRQALGPARLAGLWLLQTTTWALLLLVLWQPTLLLQSLRERANTVALMLDVSGSMERADPEPTRLTQARAALADPAVQGLQGGYQLRRFSFTDAATEVPDFTAPPPAEGATDIGHAVLGVLQQLRGEPVGAILLASDGADNAGALDPAVLEQIVAFGVPVHVIGVGREQMPEDLELQSVSVPARTLPGTSLDARVVVRHDGPGQAQLKVYDGDRFLLTREIALPAQGALTSASVPLELPEAGYRSLRFVLDAAPGERELGNNERSAVVQVAEGKASILYVEGEPRWEYKFIRRALDDDASVRLASWLRLSPNGYYRQGIEVPDELQAGFPTDAATLFRYSALIIGSVPAASFTPAQQQLIRDFVSERGGSLLMLGGPNGLGDGGWGNSVVGSVLPVSLPGAGKSFIRQRIPLLPSSRGLRQPVLQFSDNAAENLKQWQSLPPVADYQQLGALRPAAITLLEGKIGERTQPVFVEQSYGRGHALVLATSGTWRWQMGLPLQDMHHELFWRQLARSLVIDTPEPFALTATSRGARVALRAELRDAQYAVQSGAELSVMAANGAARTRIALNPLADQSGVYTAEWEPDRSGNWFLEAEAQRGAKSLGKARTVINYQKGGAEAFSLRQNRALLAGLAAATGGRYWQPGALQDLPDAIRASRAGVSEQQSLPLWNAPVFFLLLLALKSSEWLLRRRWGVV